MKVTKENAVVGLKVLLDKDSQFAGQGIGAEYGVIVDNETHFPTTPKYLWVQVNWIKADGAYISTNYYRIGDDGKFDLNVYEVIPEYVECIKGSNTDLSVNDFNVVGKIYEVESYNPKTERLKLKGFQGSIASITFDGNSGSLCTDYKISDKTSFDAQQNPKETLVGRYLKALVNNPVCIGMDIGEYLLITKYNHQGNTYDVTRVRDNHTGFGIEVVHLPKFEVMPVGFNPNEVKEKHSFYVKYEPDFTEDIFNKLKEWCNKNISLPRTWRTITDNTYQSFESNQYFFIEDGTKGLEQSFGVDNNKQGAEKQLSLSELCTLIGYKQEVKEESIEEDLISQAKQRYPIGTKFIPAHVQIKLDDDMYCVVTNHFYIKADKDGDIIAYTDKQQSHSTNSKYGNTNYERVLYDKKLSKWAEIVSEPKTNTSEEFKVGDWVVPLNDNTSHDRNIGEAYQIETLDGSIAVRMFNRELKYDGNGWIEIKDLRKATPEEIAKVQGYNVPLPDKHLQPSEPSSTASIDRILHYCRLRYKEGDTVIPLSHHGEATYGECTLQGEIQKYSNQEVGTGQTPGFLYANGKYAEIISSPKQEFVDKYPLVPEDCFTFVEPKKQKYQFSEVEYLAKPINQQLDLPIVKKYKKKSIINL
jgi:hypothetical protein